MFVFDDQGNLVSSNDAHLRMHRRKRDELNGHNYREWTPPSELATTEHHFSRSLRGEPEAFTRQIARNDGTLVIGRAQLVVSDLHKRKVVMGTMQILDTPDSTPKNTRDIAEYISKLTSELALLAAQSGLSFLSNNLEEIASNAGIVFEMLGKQQKDQ